MHGSVQALSLRAAGPSLPLGDGGAEALLEGGLNGGSRQEEEQRDAGLRTICPETPEGGASGSSWPLKICCEAEKQLSMKAAAAEGDRVVHVLTRRHDGGRLWSGCRSAG